MTRTEVAVQRFSDTHNCAQAVLTTYAPLFDVKETDALRLATGFGGGMGRLQEVCGAVTGAFMVIGCCCGMRQPADKAAKDRTYDLVHELGVRFAASHGTLLCRDLLGCDLNTADGKAQFKEQKLRDTKCSVYVRDASRLLEEMLPLQK